MGMFYSQNGQDRFLYENFFKDFQNGSFIEIGALDGVKFSNSLFFENMGWKTVLCEANPKQKNNLLTNRNKESCLVINKAVIPETENKEVVEFLSFTENTWGQGLSGIYENYDSSHLNRIRSELQSKKIPVEPSLVNVKTIKINSLLHKAEKHLKTNHFDVITVDVEGAEIEIIKTIEFEKFNFNFIVFEDNYHKDDGFLLSKGFNFIKTLGSDKIYKRIEK